MKMKKLGKLTISLNKIIKNEELVNLRGGYDDGGGSGAYFLCTCTNGVNPPFQSPWCKKYSSLQSAYDDVSTKCVGGEGSCRSGCF